MRVAIVADGSTGDLQPFCGLAYALHARQHEVLVVANENHRTVLNPLVAAGAVLSVTYVPVNFQTILKNPDEERPSTIRIRSALARGDYWRFMTALVENIGENDLIAAPITLDALRVFQPHIIVCGTVALSRCIALSELLGVPMIHGNYIPIRASAKLWPMSIGGPPRGSETAARCVLSGTVLAVGGGLPLAILGALIAPAIMNRVVGTAARALISSSGLSNYNRMRTSLGLQQETKSVMQRKLWTDTPVLPSYSVALFQGSTSEAADAAGYWYGPEWALAEENMGERDTESSSLSSVDHWSDASTRVAVESFIRTARCRGKRVVSVGWVSMVVLSTEHLSALATAAAAIADVALVLIGGWSGVASKYMLMDGVTALDNGQGRSGTSILEKRVASMVQEANAVLEAREPGMTLAKWLSIGENVIEVDAIAHSFLFKRMDCVVHHGGSGTTAASARSGTPTVITPVLADQDGWAARMEGVGAGIRARNITRLSAKELARHIATAAGSAKMRACAQDLMEKVRLDGGAAEAARKLEDVVGKDTL